MNQKLLEPPKKEKKKKNLIKVRSPRQPRNSMWPPAGVGRVGQGPCSRPFAALLLFLCDRRGRGKERTKKQRATLDDTVHVWFSHAAEHTEKVVTSPVQAGTGSPSPQAGSGVPLLPRFHFQQISEHERKHLNHHPTDPSGSQPGDHIRVGGGGASARPSSPKTNRENVVIHSGRTCGPRRRLINRYATSWSRRGPAPHS